MYHLDDMWDFEREPDGAVVIRCRIPGDRLVVRIGPDVWCSVVAAMSARGESQAITDATLLHRGRCEATQTTPTIPDGEPWTIRCDLPSGHSGKHRSDAGGMLWGAESA